jgi:hypothetical protein
MPVCLIHSTPKYSATAEKSIAVQHATSTLATGASRFPKREVAKISDVAKTTQAVHIPATAQTRPTFMLAKPDLYSGGVIADPTTGNPIRTPTPTRILILKPLFSRCSMWLKQAEERMGPRLHP